MRTLAAPLTDLNVGSESGHFNPTGFESESQCSLNFWQPLFFPHGAPLKPPHAHRAAEIDANSSQGRVRTRTVKGTARSIVEKYYPRLTLDFDTNKRVRAALRSAGGMRASLT